MASITIYVYVLDEGTDVWRPVSAVSEGGDLYRITSPDPDPEDEHWQFPSGSRVRCARRPLNGEQLLVAIERAEP